MRRVFRIGAALAVAGALGGLLTLPAQAAPQKFEGAIAFSAPEIASELGTLGCPDGGDLDGTFYKLVDLKSEFKKFKVAAPPRTLNVADPSGAVLTGETGEYDIDMYAYDAKCNDITPAEFQGPAATSKFETRKPARYIIVHYYLGVVPNLPFVLEASN